MQRVDQKKTFIDSISGKHPSWYAPDGYDGVNMARVMHDTHDAESDDVTG